MGEFAIGSGEDIDRVSGQDGIEVTNISLGNAFPQGLFISQDNLNPPANQNFKLVPWQSISLAMIPALIIDPAANPHQLSGPLGSPPPEPATATPVTTPDPTAPGGGGTSTGELIVIGGFLLLIASLLGGAGFFYLSGVLAAAPAASVGPRPPRPKGGVGGLEAEVPVFPCSRSLVPCSLFPSSGPQLIADR